MKGNAKDRFSADYVDYLPVNMLATPKEILDSNGYLRSFPGIQLRTFVDGASRGVKYNTTQDAVYRVCGNRLYRAGYEVAPVSGTGRVSMAHSRVSHAVIIEGRVTQFKYDGGVSVIDNWPESSGYARYDIGSASDIVRVRGRYIWAKKGSDSFFISDLEDETKPDRYSAEYRAESQSDGIVGLDVWRDFVVCFGTNTTEFFALTGNSGAGAAVYVNNPAYFVPKGIAGTYCKCSFMDDFAIISHPATGSPSIYLMGSGQVKTIATATVEKILRSYSLSELSRGVLEPLRFDSHELLMVHLPRHVLIFDASASQNGPQWTILKTGLNDDVYRAIDFAYEGNDISCGDKSSPYVGQVNFNLSSQYDVPQEHLLYTPMFKADNARVFDLELEAVTGAAQMAQKIFISATADGVTHGEEKLLHWDKPFRYDRRVIWKRVGRIRKNIAFKIRVITNTPVTLSGCQVRVE